MPPSMKFTYSPPKRLNTKQATYARTNKSLESYRGGTSSEESSARTVLGSPSSGGAASLESAKACAARAEHAAREGKLSEAEALYRKAVEAHEQQMAAVAADGSATARDTELIDALRASAGLARVLKMQGKYDAAETIYRSSLTRAEGWLGASHPGTLKVANFLALLLAEQGRPEAKELFQRALAGFEQGAGHTHPDTLSIVSNLANLHTDMGELHEAEPLYRRALDGFEANLGPTHPATCSARNGLATLYAELGQLEQAAPLMQQALAGYEECLGAAHPETLASVHNMATLLLDLGAFSEAAPLFRRALEGREQTLGPSHPATRATVHGFARMLREHEGAPAAEALLVKYGEPLEPPPPVEVSDAPAAGPTLGGGTPKTPLTPPPGPLLVAKLP